MSAQMLWCPYCNRMVAAEREKSNRAVVIIILTIFGIALIVWGGWLWKIVGIIELFVTGILFIVGLFTELVVLRNKAHCPICKGEDLRETSPAMPPRVQQVQVVQAPPGPTPSAVVEDAPPIPQKPPTMPPYSK